MDSYFQFLESAYHKVIDACAQDQSLNILKTIDNKNFYLSRVHEIFTEIYCAERENTVKNLLEENQRFKANLPEKQRKLFEEGNEPKERQIFSNRQSEAILVRENEKLSRQIQQVKEDQIHQIEQLSAAYDQKVKNYEKQIQALNIKIENLTLNLASIKEKNQASEIQLTKISEELEAEQYKQKVYENRNKQFIVKISMLEQRVDKLTNENKLTRETNDIYENKIKQLSEGSRTDKEKLKEYEKQLNKIVNSLKSQPQIISHEANKDDQQNGVSPLLKVIQEKQEQFLEIVESKSKLKEDFESLEDQYTQYKIMKQKQIFQLRQKSQRDTIEYQDKVRDLEENLMKLQKNQNHIQQFDKSNDRDRSIQVKKLQQQLDGKKKRVDFLQKTNKQLASQYEQIAENARKQKKLFEIEKFKVQTKLQEAKKLQKQLMNHIKIKNLQESGLEQQYRRKIADQNVKIIELQETITSLNQTIKHLKENINQKKPVEPILCSRLIEQEHENQLESLQMEINRLNCSIKQLRQESRYRVKQMEQLCGQKNKIEEQNMQMKFSIKKNKQKQEKHAAAIQQLQNALLKQKQKGAKLHEEHRKQISEIYEKHQKNTQEITKQLEKHYSTIIANQKPHNSDHNSETIPPSIQIVRELEHAVTQAKTEIGHLRQKIQEKNREIEYNEEKLSELEKTAKSQSAKIADLGQRQQRLQTNKIQIIQYYEEKIKNYRLYFKEFKYQFCQQILHVMRQFKSEINSIKQSILSFMGINRQTLPTTSYSNLIPHISGQIMTKVSGFYEKIMGRYLSQIKNLKENVIPNIERQKLELQSVQQNKLREKSLETMSILAEKEYQIGNLKEEKNQLKKKYRELDEQCCMLLNKCRKQEEQNVGSREIIKKMEQNVYEADRQKQYYLKELNTAESQVQELKGEIAALENKHHNQMSKCRQKYAVENQRIFNRYEKQFGKMLKLNEKTKQYMVQRVVPTREESKVQKLKREILEQKMKIQSMEKTNAKPTSYK